jgi:hypothetical protein
MASVTKKFKGRFTMKTLVLFWFRFARTFFRVLFLLVLCGGVFVWYDNVYRGGWNDAQKKQYIETTSKETVFKENDFLKAVDMAKKKSDLFTRDVSVTRDLFMSYPEVNAGH